MTTLLIAIGNTLRRDDGAAHRVLDLLAPLPAGVSTRRTHQLTPELAEELAAFERVVFIDASIEAGGEPVLEPVPVDDPLPASSISHSVTPASVVMLSRKLFGFEGDARLLGVPARDFGLGESLSEESRRAAGRAAEKLRAFLDPPE